MGIGAKLVKPMELAFGLLLLAFSPVLISLSFAVLTEPSYIAVVYVGFWYFLRHYRNPKVITSAVLGFIFGLAFLNRTEGIVYLAVIPALQVIYFLWKGRTEQSFKSIIYSCLVFAFCFSCMAVPQIMSVSQKVGSFALNGRQIWTKYSGIADNKSRKEMVYGLDFSPSQTNMAYLTEHPDILRTLSKRKESVNYINSIKKLLQKIDNIYHNSFCEIVGPLGFMLLAFGFLALLQRQYHFELFVIVSFILLNLSFSIIPEYPKVRYMAIALPFIFLLEGVGIVYITNSLFKHNISSVLRRIFPFMILFTMLIFSAITLKSALLPPQENREYSPAELKTPAKIVREIAKIELKRAPVVTAHKRYLSYYTDATHYYIPFSDYKGLMQYCYLNNVDFIYLKYKNLKNYPFIEKFLDNDIDSELQLLFSGTDAAGDKIELYKFNREALKRLVTDIYGFSGD
jgi:hypothetical protein